MKGRPSTGKCEFCSRTFSREEIARHLNSCDSRKAVLQKQIEKPGTQEGRIFHFFVEGYYQTAYWMHLDVQADATLHDLDRFLRDIWLECCNHLSAFTIEKKRYSYHFIAETVPWGTPPEEFDMNVELQDVLRPRLRFCHEYDYGTPTKLSLKVLSFREGSIRGKKVQLLARNDPPVTLCDFCGQRKATLICMECDWSDDSWLCDLCAQDHEYNQDMFLPVVNSPRTGTCGYTGHTWIGMSKTVEDNDPCPCGSGKDYLRCCWIRDVLWEKREKSKIPTGALGESVKDKVFKTRDEFQRFADDMMEGYNREPDEDFLGLSSEQILRLLYFPMEQNEEMVKLNRNLPPRAFEKVPIVHNTLFFLSALSKVEPLKATAKGNLPVKFARLLFDEIEDSRFKKWIRIRSEENSIKILALRHVLRIAGWIRKEKQKFKLTRRGHELLANGFSERDFYRLLQTFAEKFNWGFQDRYPTFWIIQGSWIFSLFTLHRKAKTYAEDVTIARNFISAFPEISLEVDEFYISAFEYVNQCFSYRFLEKFCENFGFVEARRERKKGSFTDRLFVKTTPLFDQYFIWNV